MLVLSIEGMCLCDCWARVKDCLVVGFWKPKRRGFREQRLIWAQNAEQCFKPSRFRVDPIRFQKVRRR